MDDAGDLLSLLVPLAGDHDDVACLAAPAIAASIAERRSGSTSTSVPVALDDRLDDRERVLRARVVARDDHPVCQLARDLTHQRALLAVAVAAGAEDDRRAGPSPSGRAAPSTVSSASGVCA